MFAVYSRKLTLTKKSQAANMRIFWLNIILNKQQSIKIYSLKIKLAHSSGHFPWNTIAIPLENNNKIVTITMDSDSLGFNRTFRVVGGCEYKFEFCVSPFFMVPTILHFIRISCFSYSFFCVTLFLRFIGGEI